MIKESLFQTHLLLCKSARSTRDTKLTQFAWATRLKLQTSPQRNATRRAAVSLVALLSPRLGVGEAEADRDGNEGDEDDEAERRDANEGVQVDLLHAELVWDQLVLVPEGDTSVRDVDEVERVQDGVSRPEAEIDMRFAKLIRHLKQFE